MNSFTYIIEKLYKFCQEKINYENLALDEKDNNQDGYHFIFKVKISMTLKNQNLEVLNSFNSLISSVNSFISILFQITQVKNIIYFF